MRCMGTIKGCSWFLLTAAGQSAYIFALNILINTLFPVGKFIPKDILRAAISACCQFGHGGFRRHHT